MRNQHAKVLLEGRTGKYRPRTHSDTTKRAPTKKELLEEALIQDDLMDDYYQDKDVSE